DLAGVAPLYLAPPRGGALRARELRLLGDGIVGVSQAVLAAPGAESRVRDLVVEALAGEAGWDLLDVTLVAPPPPAPSSSPSWLPTSSGAGGDAEALARRFGELGRDVERDDARGRPVVDLAAPWEQFVET